MEGQCSFVLSGSEKMYSATFLQNKEEKERKILVSINKVNYKSDINTTLSYTLSITEKENNFINLSLVCYLVLFSFDFQLKSIFVSGTWSKYRIPRARLPSKLSVMNLPRLTSIRLCMKESLIDKSLKIFFTCYKNRYKDHQTVKNPVDNSCVS
jgi:hypothetical protein